MKRQILWQVVIVASLTLFCFAFAQAKSVRQELSQESTLEKVQKRGVLKVGFSTFVPWAMKNKKGEFIGFEIDVAKELAQDIGVEPEFIPTKWSGIIPSLLTGKFDIIIGGMGIRPERNLKVNFSIPYDHSGMSIVANKQLAQGFNSLEGFNKSKINVVARLGTTAAEAARRHLPEARLRLFDDEAQALQEVLNDNAHAMVSSQPFPEFQSIKHSKKLFLPLEGKTFTKEPIGFAIRKGDIDFLNFLNNWTRVKHAQGWLEDRHNYWFTTMKWKEMME
jgi:polar amino acid transport system substrate-binding protein